MELHVGTSGYSYKEWNGSFYPEDLAAGDMLRYYGERLGAVEINNTFYRLPTVTVLESWAEQVPASFRFSIKASQKITHRRRLAGADEETGYLVRTVRTLGERLGVLLFQLPPNLKKDTERLAGFLRLLPPGLPAAFEFRHESWMDDDVAGLLRAHGAALCCADTEDSEQDAPIVATADFGYLRLRRPGYGDDELKRWLVNVRAQGWQRAFVFFKHEDEAAGPKMAARFLELAG
ncbi:MAG TPA: DUF72 domain-containing protein [Longimicrobiales bacterium]|nr:DUF72 domain-containing protein [Longimicrobiales bacterium]